MKEEMLTLLVNRNANCEKRAIKGSNIASYLSGLRGKKVYVREVNNLARDLRQDGYRVISSKSSNGGYFITNNMEELMHFYNLHKSHSNKHLEECQVVNSLMIGLADEEYEKGKCTIYQQKSPSTN
jgi:predicted transcriptional regulator